MQAKDRGEAIVRDTWRGLSAAAGVSTWLSQVLPWWLRSQMRYLSCVPDHLVLESRRIALHSPPSVRLPRNRSFLPTDNRTLVVKREIHKGMNKITYNKTTVKGPGQYS